MKEIKNKENQERRKYVPASVKVIEFTAQRVLCGSEENFRTSNPFGGDEQDWSRN